MQEDPKKIEDEEDARREFLVAGKSFFSWNSGKNTPNILLQLVDRLGHLDNSIKEASDSSGKLANALNRLTLAAVIISFLSLVAFVTIEILKMRK